MLGIIMVCLILWSMVGANAAAAYAGDHGNKSLRDITSEHKTYEIVLMVLVSGPVVMFLLLFIYFYYK